MQGSQRANKRVRQQRSTSVTSVVPTHKSDAVTHLDATGVPIGLFCATNFETTHVQVAVMTCCSSIPMLRPELELETSTMLME